MRILLALVMIASTVFARYPADATHPENKAVPRAFGLRLSALDNHDSTHAYDIRCYRLDLTLPMTNATMQGRERITLTSRRSGLDSVALHMDSLVCDSARIGATRLTVTRPPGLLVVRLDRGYAPGESLDIDIWYHRNNLTRMQGFYWYPRASTGHHVLAYSTTEPTDSRFWFPCFDDPWDKAEQGCRINITVPDTLSACSNGLLDSVTTSGATRTWWWRESYPISTYLMTFAASRWATFKQWFHLSPSESTYIQNFIWPEDSTLAVNSFRNTVDMMNFFSDTNRYGRYPFEKYGMVEAYPFPWGGMENQTLTMVHHSWVTGGDDNGIAHEMAHQWWGDRTTCLDWRNIWLNEGFGTFSDELYYYRQNGRSSFVSLMSSRASSYFSSDAAHRFPLYAPAMNLDSLFDWGHTYCKASWVPHMLRYLTGDTVFASPGIFFRALRAYGDSTRYGNANTDDHCRIVERVTGLSLGWFFNEWVYQAGYPNYTVTWRALPWGANYRVVMDIAQSNGAQAPACFHMPLQVKIRKANGDTIVTIPIAASPQHAEFTVSANPTALVVDPDGWVLQKNTLRSGSPDVAVRRILAPIDTLDSAAVAIPSVLVRNSGNLGVPFKVFFRIDSTGGNVYQDSVALTYLMPGDSVAAVFRAWPQPHRVRNYTTRCSVYVAFDVSRTNDTLSGTFTVVALPSETGWVRKADMPPGARGRKVRDGGALASGSSSYIYAFKGNNGCEFYRFDPAGNTWATLDSIPAVGTSGRNKGVKKGSALVAVAGLIYGFKGNNSLECWEYAPGLGLELAAWAQKADVPVGARALREGAGAVGVTTADTAFVYLLKGSSTSEFYRYNPITNTWQTRASAPLGVSGKTFKSGSALATDGTTTIWALKGSFNELAAYDVATDAWTTRTGLPLVGSSGKKKKAKDGAGLAHVPSAVTGCALRVTRVPESHNASRITRSGILFALKGGNTSEFWIYQCDSDCWTQQTDIPVGTGRKVRSGGALVGVGGALYALKGNNTLDFFKYGIPATDGRLPTANGQPTVQSSLFNHQSSLFNLRIAPNPLSGATAITYTIPRPGNISLKLYDLTGKPVATLAQGYRPAGSHVFPLGHWDLDIGHSRPARTGPSRLARGVYVLRLETAVGRLTSKLIVE